MTTYAGWQDFSHRRTPVRAIRHDGHEQRRLLIADGVNRSNPGLARITPAGELLIRTQLRSAAVPDGYWVGIGYHGHPWVISDEVFTGCYDPLGHGADLGMTDEQLQDLRARASGTLDPTLLREYANTAIAAALARR